MLGHNIPKPVATGKIARDIREAVKQSFSQSGHEENSDLQKRKYVIIWKQIMDCHFKVITYFAIDKNYRGQGLGRELIEVIVDRAKTQDVAACLLLTVNALHTKEYSAVGFYEKCKFAKLSPLPQMDVWPMYKTIWVK